MPLLKIEAIHKDYHLGKSLIHALKGVSFTVEEGDFICVVGPSGCGKTTLLNIIGCIDTASSGKVFFKEKDLSRLTDNHKADIRLREIGFIFQSFNLVPVLSCFENIEFPLILAGVPKKERQKRTARLIELVGLSDFAEHKPDELSGGQRQRVAIARALVNTPSLVIADEPTANLDSETGRSIIETMNQLNREENVTFIFSTHNPEIMNYARTLIHLKDGTVTGTDQEVLR